MGPFTIYLLFALSLLINPKTKVKEKLLLILWFLFPLSIQAMLAKTFTARYILFVLPPFFVLSGFVFSQKNKKLLYIAKAILVIFALQAVFYNKNLLFSPQKASLPRSERSGYLEEWTAGTGIKETADYIKQQLPLNPNQKIVIGTEGYFGTLPDGLQMYLNNTPQVTVIGIGLGIKETPQSLVESAQAKNRTFLLANTSRLKFEKEPKELGLYLVKQFKKADRPE
jgi:hypothetical protein